MMINNIWRRKMRNFSTDFRIKDGNSTGIAWNRSFSNLSQRNDNQVCSQSVNHLAVLSVPDLQITLFWYESIDTSNRIRTNTVQYHGRIYYVTHRFGLLKFKLHHHFRSRCLLCTIFFILFGIRISFWYDWLIWNRTYFTLRLKIHHKRRRSRFSISHGDKFM